MMARLGLKDVAFEHGRARKGLPRVCSSSPGSRFGLVTLPLPHLYSGKVRDIFGVGDHQLLMVTSDRLSAFDVVLDEPILHKGRVLTAISAYWFEVLGDVVGSHLVSTDVADLRLRGRLRPGPRRPHHALPQGRMLSIECIVRGYLTGSAWKECRPTARCTASCSGGSAGARRAA